MRRTSPDDLIPLLDDLADHAAQWEFFALGRAVEQEWPAGPRIGTSLDPAEERIELAHEPSIDFPRTTIAGFERADIEQGRRRPTVRSQQMGLTGPMGPLPAHLTEIAVLERGGSGAKPFTDFLDMISARMLQSFYRAWASGNPCAQADRPDDDDFAGFLGAVGGSTSLRFVSGAERPAQDEEGVGSFDDWRRLAYGGHLSGLRSAAAVGDLIGHALGRPVRVDEAVGRWRPVLDDARTTIGRRGAHSRLGTGAMLGGRFYAVEWDVALRVRASSMAELDQLLPGGDVHRLLAEAAAAVLPAHLDWHAWIEIDEAAIEPARLGSARITQAGLAGSGARLGMTGWVGARRGSEQRSVLADGARADRVRADVRLANRADAGRKAMDREYEGEVA